MKFIATALAAALLFVGCDAEPPTAAALTLAPTDLLGATAGGDDGFERALPGDALAFPDDHGAHGDYRAEWWYFTGHLSDENDRAYGFQLTFFRYAVQPDAPDGASPWRTRQVAMAHFALTDEDGARYHFDEKLGRSGAGLAGAQATPFRVWHDDWYAESHSAAFLPMTLSAGTDQATIALTLSDGKPRVLQGEAGLSQKGRAPGNASWYYSYTRMPVSGHVTVAGERRAVKGAAWLDREWSTSSLDADLAGWDWFALQLDDGRELMFYRLRTTDGGASRFSTGVLIDADDRTTALGADDVVLTPTREWRSERSGAAYPIVWQIDVPAHGLSLEFAPLLDAQEQGLSVFYWEGAGRVLGTSDGEAITGRAYAELTGYADR
ncbi:MAG: lipocalin-like domain-containing protein [Pseudomonadota bacterium]